MHADCTTSAAPARMADTDWHRFALEAEALAQELEADGHDPRYAGRFAADLVDELADFAREWDAMSAAAAGEAAELADLLARAEAGQLADDRPQALPDAPAPRTPAHERAAAKASYHLAGGLELRRVGGACLVPSGTRGGTVHRVEQGVCSCEAGQNGRPCWHVEAVAQVEAGALAPMAA